MAATFNLLRGRDLIWSYVVNNYLLGRGSAAVRPAPLEFSDTTNLPASWHRDYLETLYRENKLVEPGGISVAGTPIDLGKVKTPTYVQAGREDHIAPPQSVWKITHHFSGPMRFVLAGSGHIAGVVNPPAAGKYQYWTNDQPREHARGVRRRRDRAQGQLVARLDRLAEERRTRRRCRPKGARVPGKGKLQGDRGRARALCEGALSRPRSTGPADRRARDLEELQRRASLALPEYRAAPRGPSRRDRACPPSRSSAARCMVAEMDGRMAGFAVVLVTTADRARRAVRRAANCGGRGIGRRWSRPRCMRRGAAAHALMVVAADPRRAASTKSCGFTVEGDGRDALRPGAQDVALGISNSDTSSAASCLR